MNNSSFLKNLVVILTEITVIFLIVFNVLPREAALILTGLLIFYFIFSPLEDSLWVFIASIPLFVALPITENFDSMSNWRILLAVLFLVLFYRSGLSISLVKNKLGEWRLRENFKLYPIEYLLGIFLVIGCLSLFAASNAWVGIKKLLFLINIFLIFIIIRNLAFKNKDIINKIISAVWVALGLTLAVGYVQFMTVFFTPLYDFWQFWARNVIPVFYGQNLGRLLSYSNTWFSYYDSQPPTLRMFSVFPDSHSFALFLIIGLPFLLTLILSRPKENKKLLFVLYPILIILLLALIFSGSRGIWVSASALLALSLIITNLPRMARIINFTNKYIREIRETKTYQLLIGSLIIFFLLFPIASWFLLLSQKAQISDSDSLEDSFLVFERAKSIADLTEISAKSRLEIWRRTFDSIAAHPVLGVGIGNFPVVLGEDIKAGKRGASAHNLYLDVAAEMGIFALLILLALFWETLKTAWKLCQRTVLCFNRELFSGIWAGFFGLVFIWILFYSLFDIVLLNDKALLFFTVSLALLFSSE